MTAGSTAAGDPIGIGSRRELFVDNTLIQSLSKARRVLHHPTPREIVLTCDAPWEGSGSGYLNVFRDGNLYKMYYKAWHLVVDSGKLEQPHPLFTCYAESVDGIAWRKPDLGLHEYNGSRSNNIVLVTGKLGGINIDAGHTSVFKDGNPACSPDARYKALVRNNDHNSKIYALKSPDGLRWTPVTTRAVLSDGWPDSQNVAFWDSVRGEYRAYYRKWAKPGNTRIIRTATSPDFLKWSNNADLTYEDSPIEHLYTNQVTPYPRAPHIFIGFPARYVERGWSDSMRALPELEHRKLRSRAQNRFGMALTESLLMSSRNGVHFQRWNEAFLRPGIQRPGTWAYGHQYIGWHLVETKPALEGAPNEYSLYATESYWTGRSSAVRRYTIRLDGFVSVQAPFAGGEMSTKPITFSGKLLKLNFSTGAAGSIRVEIQTAAGKPISGYTLREAAHVFGDEPERVVSWKSGKDVSKLAGQPVRLRFVMQDADLFAFRFE